MQGIYELRVHVFRPPNHRPALDTAGRLCLHSVGLRRRQ
jgi:hypothetical protein